MRSNLTSDESSDQGMISTQESGCEKVDDCQAKNKKQKNVQQDCCSHHSGKERRCCYKVINITPLCKLYISVIKTFVGWTKYYFYVLIGIFYPLNYYRFFIRFGITPFNDPYTLLYMFLTAFFMVMAYWSHDRAGPKYDPGFVDWDHFRSEDNRIKNRQDRQKWIDIKNGKEATVELKDNIKYPQSCEKCGSLRVLGVHHCGKCKRCVYKMDHHCPWTDNCVGYLTIKPFILFLFYVTCISFFTGAVMYRQAWVLRMQHISLVQSCIPPHSSLKHYLTMWYLNDAEREELNQINEMEYQHQVEFEKLNPDIFCWAFFKEFFLRWEFTRFYWLYSWETFWDGVSIFVTLICGLYTFGLMVQTLNFARQQSSMIDDMKIKMFMKDRRKFKKELNEYIQKQKRRKTLTIAELIQFVFQESTLFSIHTWIPIYREPRSLDLATEEFLKNFDEEEKKIQ